MQHIVRVESSGNAYAIGVVANQLTRQPRELAEAVATAQALEREGHNYSIGVAQVNRIHFPRLQWSDDIRKGFDQCRNLAAGAGIFNDCYARAVASKYSTQAFDETARLWQTPAVEAALSCYYSGSLTAGTRLGYSKKVLNKGGVNSGTNYTVTSMTIGGGEKGRSMMID